ncbi:YlbF family regulator [Lactovum miscens]|uniref:Cell fate (Sporulation/competence/biofilm development) regulator YlbF (YheA/YmcA/DUF963 family) n=1 Tax=Lactovum miscens TaxID=190387 RepID=A0A841CAA0_9LACT|nr:YlbF family regulator [Lactovum miscens]MBB5888110.1 cell fate (sporulation/competence/biofilm development) regulator YlbF (YheA/YmcA/DUF963 family) [Lactovum miscens]
MLHLDEKLLAIDDEIEKLVDNILKTKQAQAYCQAREEFLSDFDLQADLQTLNENLNFIDSRTEFKDLKKRINMNPKVYAFRLAENDLQEILSGETSVIVSSVSEHINIDENLPLKGGHHHHRRN